MGCQATDAGQTPRKGMSCGPRALAASAAAVAVTLAVVVFAPSSPAILPMRVLVDGGGGGELVATVEAEYHDASWHSTGIDGGSCAVVTGALPVLRAAVLRPRSLGAERVSIDVVVTELWPTRVHQALQAGGVMECTLAAHVDIFRTGWRVERKLRWSLDASQGPATISVRPQQVKPGVEDGAVSANASYLFEAGLSPGSALGAFLRAVPVAVRAELGYVEESEGALQGHVAVDAELAVTTEAGTGRVVVAVPFTTRTSASIPSLMRCAARAPATAGTSERALVFAAAPGAAATASLLGGRHTVAWSRNLSFAARPEGSRRLATRRLLDADLSQLPALHDLSLLHRFRLDDEVLEVLVAVAGGDPAQATLRVRHGAAFTGAAFTDLMSVTVRTDRLLEPITTLGDDLADLETDLGTFATFIEGDKEVTRWSSPPDMGANITQRGDDFSISVLLPGSMTGALELAGGALKGSFAQGGVSIASLDLALKQPAGSGDYELAGPLLIHFAPPPEPAEAFQVSLTVKPAQDTGGAVVGSLAHPSGTMSVDAKFEVSASGDVSSHALIKDSSSPSPALDFKLSLDVVEPSYGRFLSSLDMSGNRMFSADAGCTRSATSGDTDMHLVLKTVETEPALANASLDFDSDPIYGGRLAAFAEALGEPLFRAWLVAGEIEARRTVDLNLTMGADTSVLGCSLLHSKPDAADVSINATVLSDGVPIGKGAVWGKALDQVLATEAAEDGRRELVLASPGAWGASMSMPPAEGGMVEVVSLAASLAQVGSLVTLEAAVPAMQVGFKLLADSSSAGAVLVDATLTGSGDPDAGTSTSTLSVGGRMEHSGPMSSGRLQVATNGEVHEAVDLRVSRGFLPSPDSTYKFNVSAAADLSSSLGVVVDVKDAYVKTFADWGFAGAGWGLSLLDAQGGETLQQAVGLAMAMPPPAEGAESVAGSMTVEVQGDVAAFIADPAVKMGFRQGIADIVSVPSSAVTVALSVARRLGEARRLAGAVKVDYNITMPAGRDATAAAAAISATPPAEMAVAISKAIAAASGGASNYSMTITEASTPQASTDPKELEPASKAAGAFGVSALWLAALGFVAA